MTNEEKLAWLRKAARELTRDTLVRRGRVSVEVCDEGGFCVDFKSSATRFGTHRHETIEGALDEAMRCVAKRLDVVENLLIDARRLSR